jgi:hypothetical protein
LIVDLAAYAVRKALTRFAEGDRLAVADERKTADADFAAALFRPGFRQPDGDFSSRVFNIYRDSKRQSRISYVLLAFA